MSADLHGDGADFYVEDQPIEEVLAAFERGEKGRTRLLTEKPT